MNGNEKRKLWDELFAAPYGTWDPAINPSGCCQIRSYDIGVVEDVNFLGLLGPSFKASLNIYQSTRPSVPKT
jgi:hypothetical protein